MKRRALLTGALAAGLLAACSAEKRLPASSTSAQPEASKSANANEQATPQGSTPAPQEPQKIGGVSEVLGDRKPPKIEKPAGDPPAELKVEDEIVGEGAEAKAGDVLTVHYSGVAWSTGEEFDSSWPREPFQFVLGQGMVIEGWDEGLVGMKVGGRRRITIPPQLGYGAAGAGDAIGPNETLIFVCDLVAAQPM